MSLNSFCKRRSIFCNLVLSIIYIIFSKSLSSHHVMEV
ncbi:hypothetical protein EVA_09066 [gut metagenome]|uniref:Uncharacterized protein n=1 Tax=gut metagenome TaxID=749906 RepID=J9GRP0_9ZZZZ